MEFYEENRYQDILGTITVNLQDDSHTNDSDTDDDEKDEDR